MKHSASSPAGRLRSLIGAALAAATLLSGCSGPSDMHVGSNLQQQVEKIPLSELDVLADPGSYIGESTAVLHQSAVEPVAEHPESALPATVTSYDRLGQQQVTITDTSRIIGLSMTGNIAATVYALGFGDRLVGRDVSTNFPGTDHLPYITKTGHSLDIEALLAQSPSVVITDGSVGPLDVVMQIRDAGIPLVFVEREASIEAVPRITRQVADALGVPELGTELAAQYRAEIDDTIAQIAQISPTRDEDRLRMAFLYLRGGSGIFYLFGDESGSGALIEALGGINVTAEIGWVGAKPMTDEALVALDPDLILVMSDGIASVGGVDGLLAEKPSVALTRAGKNRRFVDMADTEILGFGPRTAAVLDALARAIYAPDDQGVTVIG